MKRIISTSLLFLTIAGGTALADHRHGGGGGGRPNVVVRGGGHASGGVVVRQNTRPVYRGTIRPNRRVVTRRTVIVNNGNYTFHNGHTIRYSRPVIRQRYYDVRYRPQIIVENYPAEPGYVWVSGQWAWDGYEWQWSSGHYEPDAQYNVYYDDGSWE